MDADDLADELRAVHGDGEPPDRSSRTLATIDVIICPICEEPTTKADFGDHWRDEHQ